jgi:hypothetical protein
MEALSFSARASKMISFGTLMVFCLLVGLSTFSVAQDVASLSGLVTDASGAVVVSADVVLLDTKTNTRYETHTNASGSYTFPKLLPGPAYTLTVSVPGSRPPPSQAFTSA